MPLFNSFDIFCNDLRRLASSAIPLKPEHSIEGSPDGTTWQIKDVNGKPTGDRHDGKGHPKQKDPKAQKPHAHRVDVNGKPILDETGNPHLPIN